MPGGAHRVYWSFIQFEVEKRCRTSTRVRTQSLGSNWSLKHTKFELQFGASAVQRNTQGAGSGACVKDISEGCTKRGSYDKDSGESVGRRRGVFPYTHCWIVPCIVASRRSAAATAEGEAFDRFSATPLLRRKTTTIF